MSNQSYVEQELEKIVGDKDFAYPLNIAMASCWMIAHFKGHNLKILDARGKSSLADYFILGNVDNATQAAALTNQLVSELKKHGAECISLEGGEGHEWTLLDMGDIMVHVFLEPYRDIYDLDNLWGDYQSLPIPDEFYFTEPKKTSQTDTNDYF